MRVRRTDSLLLTLRTELLGVSSAKGLEFLDMGYIVNRIKVRTSLSLFDELQFYLHQLALSYSFLNSL